MVKVCIANGGLYVKMGQACSTMNHILPKEFYTTLRKLQSEALRSEGNDVNIFSILPMFSLIKQYVMIYNR